MPIVIGKQSDVTQLTSAELDTFLRKHHGDPRSFSSKSSKRAYVWKVIKDKNLKATKSTGRDTKTLLEFNRQGTEMRSSLVRHKQRAPEGSPEPVRGTQAPGRKIFTGRVAASRRAHRVPGETEYVSPATAIMQAHHGARNARPPVRTGLIGVHSGKPIGEGREQRNHRGERMDRMSHAPRLSPPKPTGSWAKKIAKPPTTVTVPRGEGKVAPRVSRNNVRGRRSGGIDRNPRGRMSGGIDRNPRPKKSAIETPLPKDDDDVDDGLSLAEPGETVSRDALSSVDQSLPGARQAVRHGVKKGYKQTDAHRLNKINARRRNKGQAELTELPARLRRGGRGGGDDPNDPDRPRDVGPKPPADGPRKKKKKKSKDEGDEKTSEAGSDMPSAAADTRAPGAQRPPPRDTETEIVAPLNPRPFGGVAEGGGSVPLRDFLFGSESDSDPRPVPPDARGQVQGLIGDMSQYVASRDLEARLADVGRAGRREGERARARQHPITISDSDGSDAAPLAPRRRPALPRPADSPYQSSDDEPILFAPGRPFQLRGGRGRPQGGQGLYHSGREFARPPRYGHFGSFANANAMNIAAAQRQQQIREAHRQQVAQRYTKRFGYNNQRSTMVAKQLHITVVRPGFYRISADSVDTGVQEQIRSLLSRLKKKIAINGKKVISKKAAFQQILSLLKDKQTVEISVLK